MELIQVRIQNFRGIADGTVRFPGHALLVGPNNVCKSTVLEALDLVLGPDRAAGPDTINEHDFHRGNYQPVEVAANSEVDQSETETATPPRIEIEVVLGRLDANERTRFRAHLEAWNADEHRPYTHAELDDLTLGEEQYVLRVGFFGWYDSEEDEFTVRTFFRTPDKPEDELEPLTKRHKQAIGFLYLRSLRTARRAASLQRGSLLDVLLRLRSARPRVWESILDGLGDLGERLDQDENLRDALNDIEQHIRKFVALAEGDTGSTSLQVSRLTREHLRTVVSYFLSSRESDHSLPFDRLGAGTSNVLVLSLLSAIAANKQNVIFAMEEPEIALGPHTQRRIISELKRSATQLVATSHSPYVAEQFLPDHILVLSRSEDGGVSTSRVQPEGRVKEKFLRQGFRLRFAEGLLGRAVLLVEGLTELYAIPAASDVLHRTGSAYAPLDLAGVVTVEVGGDGELAKVAEFFAELGIPSFVFCDSIATGDMRSDIEGSATRVWELSYRGFERLIAAEVPVDVLKSFISDVRSRTDFPSLPVPADTDADESWRTCVEDVLKARKGEGYAEILVSMCPADELPPTLLGFLGELHLQCGEKLLPADDPLAAMFSDLLPDVLAEPDGETDDVAE